MKLRNRIFALLTLLGLLASVTSGCEKKPDDIVGEKDPYDVYRLAQEKTAELDSLSLDVEMSLSAKAGLAQISLPVEVSYLFGKTDEGIPATAVSVNVKIPLAPAMNIDIYVFDGMQYVSYGGHGYASPAEGGFGELIGIFSDFEATTFPESAVLESSGGDSTCKFEITPNWMKDSFADKYSYVGDYFFTEGLDTGITISDIALEYKVDLDGYMASQSVTAILIVDGNLLAEFSDILGNLGGAGGEKMELTFTCTVKLNSPGMDVEIPLPDISNYEYVDHFPTKSGSFSM